MYTILQCEENDISFLLYVINLFLTLRLPTVTGRTSCHKHRIKVVFQARTNVIQYIHSYPPCLEVLSSICNLRTGHAIPVITGDKDIQLKLLKFFAMCYN
jgi:hypothetical protein